MKKENKKAYCAPELIVVTFKTERGFAASTLNLIYPEQGSQEQWQSDDTYSGYSWS